MSEAAVRPPDEEADERVEVDEPDAFEGRSPRDVLVDPLAFGAEVLKENPRRSVYRLRIGRSELVVKHYRERGLGDAVKGAFGRSRARTEREIAAALVDAGLPGPAPVAWARRAEGRLERWSALAMRAVRDARPLGGYLEDRFAPGDGRTAEKRPWVEAAARLLGRLHRAGFDHRDFHGGNLLVEGGASGDGRGLVVVDLHRVARSSRISSTRRVRALADLLHTLRFAVDAEETRAAVAAYLEEIGAPRGEEDVARRTRLVEHAIARRETRRRRSRTRRCLRDGSEFRPIAAGGVRGYRRRGLPTDTLFEAIAAAREAIDDGGDAARSIARRSSVAVVPAAGRSLAVKQYEGDGTRSARGRLTRGRAGRAYVAAHGLSVRGVPVPAVVAWLRTPDRAFLVVDEVAGAVPLSAASFRLSPGGPDESRAAEAAAAVADLLVRLAASGANVNDLSPKNVLLQLPAGGAVRAWLCDFDGVRLDRPPSRERWVRALGQLNDLDPAIGTRLRLAVLRRLAAHVPSLRARGTAREVARRTAARASRTLRAPSPASLAGTAP
ncbi:MAG: lipopolysaccharide kinase InaA family protein [Planctomycetota bacterium JB042]